MLRLTRIKNHMVHTNPYILKTAYKKSHYSTQTQKPEVITQKRQSARLFLLNRPSQLNALNTNMIRLIHPQLRVWQDSSLCKVILLTSTPQPKPTFCAGGDVKTLVQFRNTPETAVEFMEEEYALNHFIGTLKKPFVAIMDGITMGGGVGLSVHAPFRIATENTVFAMPETKIGLFPDVGGSFFLPRLDGFIGTYLGLTGKLLKGEEVFMAGIATHYIPSTRLPALLARLAELESDDFEVVNYAIEEFVGDAITIEKWKNWTLGGEIRKSIDRCFSKNSITEIFKALEKENTKWSLETLSKMKTLSPTSLKVTLDQLRRGQSLSFRECFKMEHSIAQECLKQHDFYEGVTKHLIEKTGDPVWKPSIDEIDKISTAPYFNTTDPRPPIKFQNDLTYHEYPHRPLSNLPTENDVKRVVEGRGLRGRNNVAASNKSEVVNWLMAHWGGYDSGIYHRDAKEITIQGGLGRGKVGLLEKVTCIVEERCQEEVGGGITWKY